MKILKRYPFISFIISLLLIFLLIFFNNKFLNKKLEEEVEQKEEISRTVEIYDLNTKAKENFTGKATNTSLVTVYAQTGGVVSDLYIQEGTPVTYGAWLAYLSTNYNGASASTVQTNISREQLNNLKTTLYSQNDLIAKQRELAEKSDENSENLLEIQNKSINGLEELKEYNKDIIKSLEEDLDDLEDDDDSDESLILQTKQALAQARASLNSVDSALDQTEYNTEGDIVNNLNSLNKEATLKSLDLQKQNLENSISAAELSLQLAQVQESLQYPTTPVTGQVEQVFVKKGDLINPGTPIAKIKSNEGDIKIEALITKKIKDNIDYNSNIILEGKSINNNIKPQYISQEPVSNGLYSLIVYIAQDENNNISDGELITLEVENNNSKKVINNINVPIDSVYISEGKNYIFIMDTNNIAKEKEVELGEITGNFIEIKKGLTKKEKVIITRGIVEGEKVKLFE